MFKIDIEIKRSKIMNQIFCREQTEKEMCEILNNFEKNHTNVNFKKGFYIYGSSGVGKTTLMLQYIKDLHTSRHPGR